MIRTILSALVVCALPPAGQRPPVKCAEESPARRGEEGDTVPTVSRFLEPVPDTILPRASLFDG